jgi:hypothetical protein
MIVNIGKIFTYFELQSTFNSIDMEILSPREPGHTGKQPNFISLKRLFRSDRLKFHGAMLLIKCIPFFRETIISLVW